MKIEDRIVYLQKLHDDLDKQIEDEYKIYKDDRLVQFLKKKKLKIKDEINTLKNGTYSNSN